MEFKFNDNTVNIPNQLIPVNAQYDRVPESFWYSEIFGSYPVYRCDFEVPRVDDDNVYLQIFNDLSSDGFSVLACSYGNKKKEAEWDDGIVKKEMYMESFVVMSNDKPLMVAYRYGDLYIYTHLGMDIISDFIDARLKKYVQEISTAKCYIITKEMDLDLREFPIKINGELDFDLYNEGFEDVHNDIVKSIKEDNNGLYLLYGAPGTGKTTYIRHLIKQCASEKRKFVYVPSNLFGDFTNPSFLSFLLGNKDCIFIIEDCESLVTIDDMGRSPAIADMLNMTDGLLADALNIKIICTFNIDDGNIDEALLRPGRCKCKYEFDLLDRDRANVVADKYGLEKVYEDKSLAELFNSGKSFVEKVEKKKIGFR